MRAEKSRNSGRHRACSDFRHGGSPDEAITPPQRHVQARPSAGEGLAQSRICRVPSPASIPAQRRGTLPEEPIVPHRRRPEALRAHRRSYGGGGLAAVERTLAAPAESRPGQAMAARYRRWRRRGALRGRRLRSLPDRELGRRSPRRPLLCPRVERVSGGCPPLSQASGEGAGSLPPAFCRQMT
jgi:hypothetical protein